MTGIIQGLLASIGSAVASAASDAYFNLVTLLLNTSSTNGAQNNTFLDSSTNNFTITRNGNTTQGTFTPFSQTGWSNYFNGSNTELTCTGSALSGQFTMEGWVYYTSTPSTGMTYFGISSDNGGYIRAESTTQIGFVQGAVGPSLTGSFTPVVGVWYHIAVTRNASNLMTIWVNGSSVASGTVSTSYASGTFAIGANHYSGGTTGYFPGYISNVRLVTGSALYTSSFTPSTTPLTAVSGTQILTCQSNRFIDNSSNAYALTVNGTPSVQAFSPFLPTAAYDTAVVGGSGYFDGSGDYLTCSVSASPTGTQNFTIEGWVYVPSAATEYAILANNNSSGGFYLRVNSSGQINVVHTNIAGIIVSSSSVKANSWNYFCVTRSGNTFNIYLNSTSVDATTSNSVSFATGTSTVVGADYAGGVNFRSYMSSLRVVIGTATAPSAVPTAPFTAITNTSLLLNFTNAGIYDSASKNVLETVGNAQVSTTQAKWGTTSMYFDGTGDYLTIPNSPTLAVGSGDFTIEGWWYPTDLSGTTHLWCLGDERSTYNGLLLYWSAGTSKLTLYSNGSAIITSSISTSTNTWYFVSVVRSGTTITLYVNGSSAGTVTNSTSFTGIAANGFCLNAEYAGSFAAGKAAYYDDFRITKGYARPSTSPTAAFPLQ